MAAVKSEVATFLKVFPQGTVWANNVDGKGYDVVMMGGSGAMNIDVNRIEMQLRSANYQRVAASLADVGINSSLQLFATYATQAGDLGAWTSDAEINNDRNLRLQYLAGTGLNYYRGESIFDAMIAGRRFPTKLFVADEPWQAALKAMIGGGQ